MTDYLKCTCYCHIKSDLEPKHLFPCCEKCPYCGRYFMMAEAHIPHCSSRNLSALPEEFPEGAGECSLG